MNYLDQKFTVIDKRFDGVKSDFNDLQSSVDSYATKADSYFQEMLMLAHKLDRLDKWVYLAEKIGLKLE